MNWYALYEERLYIKYINKQIMRLDDEVKTLEIEYQNLNNEQYELNKIDILDWDDEHTERYLEIYNRRKEIQQDLQHIQEAKDYYIFIRRTIQKRLNTLSRG